MAYCVSVFDWVLLCVHGGRFDTFEQGWNGQGSKPWVTKSGGAEITGKGGLLEGASFLYVNAKDVRDRVTDRPDLAYYMTGGAAAFTNGECIGSNVPFTPDGQRNVETLTIVEV